MLRRYTVEALKQFYLSSKTHVYRFQLSCESTKESIHTVPSISQLYKSYLLTSSTLVSLLQFYGKIDSRVKITKMFTFLEQDCCLKFLNCVYEGRRKLPIR